MRKLLFQPRARADLLGIWQHIAREDPAAASKVSEKIEAAIRGLLDTPGKGHTRADVRRPGYRFWTVYSYVIAYRFDDDSLTVLRVVHGRRNFRGLFR